MKLISWWTSLWWLVCHVHIEAMNAEKPVICYLRDDLVQLYVSSGLLNEGELPIYHPILAS